MNPQDPLSALHPLREPVLVGWWPPAPGWWVLLGMLLLLLLGMALFLWRRYRRNAYRRQALRQLQAIQAQYRQDGDSSRCIAAVNALLKSVALVAYPRRDVAASSGREWLAFLNGALDPAEQLESGFVDVIYNPHSRGPDLEQVQHSARSWIRRHKGVGQ